MLEKTKLNDEFKNIYQKMSYVKNSLQIKQTGKIERIISKSGNTFGGYGYFSNEDILPQILKLCERVGLFTKYNLYIESNKAELSVINCDNTNEVLYYSMPFSPMNIGTNDCQKIAGGITYTKRQLYIVAFDVAEKDIVEEMSLDEIREEYRKERDPQKKNELKEIGEKLKRKLEQEKKQQTQNSPEPSPELLIRAEDFFNDIADKE